MQTRRVLLALTVMAMLPTAPAAARTRAGSRAVRPPPGATVVADPPARIVDLINRDRAAAGLAPLRGDAGVRGVADRWSRQMALAGGLQHNHGYLCRAALERFGAAGVGENVAVGSSLEEIHRHLMQSAPHRANVLDPGYQLVGVGAVRTPGGLLYVTEDFLRRESPPSRPARRAPRGRRGG
ncbi:MAG: hypothetical protein QOD57_1809 [Actinomycetota bacterium]|jgi:uncharacterized protein YkwD|nr:hypothetical protein [Actinomycetota bacterium]MDQ1501036.1 hypothetical protein [Actinomycetota bacterium]MDQ1504082.1 hypothetical protein [Actinomycetota bacterium]